LSVGFLETARSLFMCSLDLKTEDYYALARVRPGGDCGEPQRPLWVALAAGLAAAVAVWACSLASDNSSLYGLY
jgi:hypothetical protein